MDQEEGLTAVDNIVTQFNTYEDFLDSQITTVDLFYLEVRATAPRSGQRRPVFRSLQGPASWRGRPLAVSVPPRSFPAAAANRGVLPALRGLGQFRIWALGVTHCRNPRVCTGCLEISVARPPGLPPGGSPAPVILLKLVPAVGGLLRLCCNSGLTPCFSFLCQLVLKNRR